MIPNKLYCSFNIILGIRYPIDYNVCHENTWGDLIKRYGGGPKLLVDIVSNEEKLEIDMETKFFLFGLIDSEEVNNSNEIPKGDDENFVIVSIRPSYTKGEILRNVYHELSISEDKKIRFWIYSEGKKFIDFQNGKSFIENVDKFGYIFIEICNDDNQELPVYELKNFLKNNDSNIHYENKSKEMENKETTKTIYGKESEASNSNNNLDSEGLIENIFIKK